MKSRTQKGEGVTLNTYMCVQGGEVNIINVSGDGFIFFIALFQRMQWVLFAYCGDKPINETN